MKTTGRRERKTVSGKIVAGLAVLCVIMLGVIGGLFFSIKEKSKDTETTEQAQDLSLEERVMQKSEPEKQPDEEEAAEADMQEETIAGAWKTEKSYQSAENGERYLSLAEGYDSRENVTKRIIYNEDGSVAQESTFENVYSEDGKLLKTSEFGQEGFLGWEEYSYDSEGRVEKRKGYGADGNLVWEEPYMYDYDEITGVLYCDHMALTYNENGEYAGSGFSNHETYRYDEKNRMTAFYRFPLTARCYMYDQTSAQIRQSLREIFSESENPVYRQFADMIEEYGEEAPIEVYCYDSNENLLEVDNYNVVTGVLAVQTVCTYQYDEEGRIASCAIESEAEKKDIIYCYDVEKTESLIIADEKKDCGILEVTWEDDGFYLDKQMLHFTLTDGTVQDKEAAYDGEIQSVEYRDITGDGIEEAIVSIYFVNTATEYMLLAFYQMQGEEVRDISPATDIARLAENVWDTEIVTEPIEGYRLVLHMQCYDKDGPMAFVSGEMTVGYRNGWEVIY